MAFHITGDAAADEILADPFALLLGMLLDPERPREAGRRSRHRRAGSANA
jgi:hypothetical protein